MRLLRECRQRENGDQKMNPEGNEVDLFMEVEKGSRDRVVSRNPSEEIRFLISCVQGFWLIKMRTDIDNQN